jgi:hypothetical protein
VKFKFKYVSLLLALSLTTSLFVGCSLGQSTYNDGKPASLVQKGVISVQGGYEYSPSFQYSNPNWLTPDIMYFAKMDGDKSTIYSAKYSAVKNGQANDQGLYVTQSIVSDKFETPTKLLPSSNDSNYDPKFYIDDMIMGPQMYITRKVSGNFDIYWINNDGTNWTDVKSLGSSINTSSNERCPQMVGVAKAIPVAGSDVPETVIERTLYFVSDRAGGKGGYDIWSAKATFSDDGLPAKFTDVKPLSDAINSKGNEDSFSINKDGTMMVFSRDGDIYSSKNMDGTWQPAKKLSMQVNTNAKEIYPSISSDSLTLYFSRIESDGSTNMYQMRYEAMRLDKKK